MARYREYDAKYEELQGRIDELEAAKRERQDRVKRFEIFIRALEKHQGKLTGLTTAFGWL